MWLLVRTRRLLPARAGQASVTRDTASGVSDHGCHRRYQQQQIVAADFAGAPRAPIRAVPTHQHNLVASYTFRSYGEGTSNQLALAAAQQVADNPGDSYNPLFLYGGVGLGKTHLMHAVGNSLRRHKPDARIVYLHSERFVADMVKALQPMPS